jgi:hypothetical protein
VVSSKVTAGYSGTPLAKKIGFRNGQSVTFVALPPELSKLASICHFATLKKTKSWSEPLGMRRFDVIHAFTSLKADLASGLPILQEAIKPDGMIWVSWPKKAAKLATDVTEDVVRAEALKLDLVDVKVAAIDATWSGLKLVIRKERRRDATS